MPRLASWTGLAALGLLWLMALPFVLYAGGFGLAGLAGDANGSRFFCPGRGPVNAAIFGHMLAGAVATGLAPVQLLGPVRRRWPALHRWSGRVLVAAALVSGAGGLVFIAARGTIGGWPMDAGFAVYGLLVLVAAAQTWRFGRARDLACHRAWGIRLFVLALGSWLYRLHYWLWYAATGGLGSQPDFWGPFDLVQNVAFYVPYLIIAEWAIRRYPMKSRIAPAVSSGA